MSAGGKDEEIRLRFSDLEILRAAMQLIKKKQEPLPYRISKLTGRSPTRVQETLTRVEKQYPQVLDYVREIRKIGLFKLKHRKQITQLSQQILEEAAREGYYVGGRRPYGYLKDSPSAISTLTEHPEEISKAKQVIEGYYVHGKSCAELAREKEISLSFNLVHRIVHQQIRLYTGYVKFKDQWFKGKHKALIDDKFWKTYVEPRLHATKPQYWWQGGRPPRGFMKKFDEWVHDSAVEENVQKAWKLRREGVGVSEIARQTGFPCSSLQNGMFHNPIYANKIKTLGKPSEEWLDAGVDPYVSFEDWSEIQKLRDTRPLWLIYDSAHKKRASDRRGKILIYIGRENPTTGQIVKKAFGSHGTTLNDLLKLRKEGRIEKKGTKWHLTEKAWSVSARAVALRSI